MTSGIILVKRIWFENKCRQSWYNWKELSPPGRNPDEWSSWNSKRGNSPEKKNSCWILILHPQDFFIYSIVNNSVPFHSKFSCRKHRPKCPKSSNKPTIVQNLWFLGKQPSRHFKTTNYQHILETTDVISVVMEHEQIFIICDICSPSLLSEERNTIKKYWFSSPNANKLIKLRPYKLELGRENRVFEDTY